MATTIGRLNGTRSRPAATVNTWTSASMHVPPAKTAVAGVEPTDGLSPDPRVPSSCLRFICNIVTRI